MIHFDSRIYSLKWAQVYLYDFFYKIITISTFSVEIFKCLNINENHCSYDF